jgi:hypothetical protein
MLWRTHECMQGGFINQLDGRDVEHVTYCTRRSTYDGDPEAIGYAEHLLPELLSSAVFPFWFMHAYIIYAILFNIPISC